VVTAPKAALSGGPRPLKLSFGTRLPVVGVSGTDVLVATPAGPTARLPDSAVHVYTSAAAIPTPTGRQLVATARLSLGLRYLWVGRLRSGSTALGS